MLLLLRRLLFLLLLFIRLDELEQVLWTLIDEALVRQCLDEPQLVLEGVAENLFDPRYLVRLVFVVFLDESFRVQVAFLQLF